MDAPTAAGYEAEEDFFRAMRSQGVDEQRLFTALRVPLWVTGTREEREREGYVLVDDPKVEQRRLKRGEIDLCAVTQRGIFVIEIKNWSGRVFPSPVQQNCWVQERTDGSIVEHRNPLAWITDKARSLHEHLLRQGCQFPAEFIHPHVAFCNKNVDLHPEIAGQENVFTPEKTIEFICSFETSTLQKLSETWLPTWLTKVALSSTLVAEAADIIKTTCSTWDAVTTHDGHRTLGDFLRFETHGKQPLPIAITRADVASITIRDEPLGWVAWATGQGKSGDEPLALYANPREDRASVVGKVKAMVGSVVTKVKAGGKSEPLAVCPRDAVAVFHKVGCAEVTAIPLVTLASISFSGVAHK